MATTTISTTAAQDARIIAALGHRLNLRDENGNPRNATGPEVKAWVIDRIREMVLEDEQAVARANAAAAITPIDPT